MFTRVLQGSAGLSGSMRARPGFGGSCGSAKSTGVLRVCPGPCGLVRVLRVRAGFEGLRGVLGVWRGRWGMLEGRESLLIYSSCSYHHIAYQLSIV